MDIIVAHAYSFCSVMLLILVTYIALYVLRWRYDKAPRKALLVVRYAVTALNLLAHFALIALIMYIDAGMEILLLSLLASVSVGIAVGGGI